MDIGGQDKAALQSLPVFTIGSILISNLTSHLLDGVQHIIGIVHKRIEPSGGGWPINSTPHSPSTHIGLVGMDPTKDLTGHGSCKSHDPSTLIIIMIFTSPVYGPHPY